MNLSDLLFEQRATLRRSEQLEKGRYSAICSDEAIYAMRKIMPKDVADFLSIEGLGQTFVDKYAQAFLDIIDEYVKKKSNVRSADERVIDTLKELEKKLVNLNKRNRLLYLPAKTTKTSIDVCDLCDADDMYALLFKQKKQLVLGDRGNTKAKDKNAEVVYKKLVDIQREINRDFREKGQYDLFVGFPFIRGVVVGSVENFEVNTPLVLFPITLTKEVNKFIVKLDTARDIVYNNNVLLAYYKFNNMLKALPNNVIDEINEDDFVSNIIEYYAQAKLKLTPIASEIIPMSTEGEKPPMGEFSVDYKMVMGKFSTYSSSMQKDLNEIINRGEINDLLADLLASAEDIDMYSEDILADGATLEQNNRIKEQEMFYINTLNSTQENVLIASMKNKELVVQGPPGTGKSQVITSLIANAVMRNKNVLMVSEKKSALDVVYSRLGELNKFTLLVDDVNNKDIFYSQVKNMIDITLPDGQEIVDNVSLDIDKYMTALTIIADKMCDKSIYGVEIYRLYNLCPKWRIEEKANLDLYCKLGVHLPNEVKLYNYPIINKLYVTFKSQSMIDKLSCYLDNINSFPILNDYRDDLSMTDAITLSYQLEGYVEESKKAEALPLLKRGKERKRVAELINAWCGRVFKQAKDAKFAIDNAPKIFDACRVYTDYINSKEIYNKLQVEAKEYFGSLKKISAQLTLDNVKVNELVYRYMVNEYLIKFERDNRTTLHNINNYNGVLDKLSSLLDKKVQLTKAIIAKEFMSEMKYLIRAKRSGEIQRLVESKRRPSVARFTDKFGAEMFKAVKVWLLTPEVVSEILPLKNGLFELVIFDEASQMYVEKAVPAIIRAKSVIIAGDSKQLRPNNLGSGRMEFDEEEDDTYEGGIAALEEESLLDVARFKYPPVMLDFHYRSRYEELIAFSNYAFYGGKLNVSPNPVSPDKPPIQTIKVDGGLWENKANKAEAREVVRLIKDALTTRKKMETIGVITFNSSQRDLILDYIDEESKADVAFGNLVTKEFERKENGEDIGLFVKNIENVQGDERDIIIFSIAYAKNENGKVVNSFGWLNQRGGENRLNVAISRAKLKIFLVHSIDPSDLKVEDCKNNGPIVLKKYLDYSMAVSQGNKERAKAILHGLSAKGGRKPNANNQRVAAQLAHELERRGYKVEANVGIGDYNIDLAVLKENNYVLGIEFDSSLYDISKNTRERDYHRWKYFNLRGWKMHRLWSSAWWDNPNKELGKILAKLPD